MVDQRAGAQVAHARLHEGPEVSRRTVLRPVNREEFVVVLDDHAGSEIVGVHRSTFKELGMGLRSREETPVQHEPE